MSAERECPQCHVVDTPYGYGWGGGRSYRCPNNECNYWGGYTKWR